MLSKFLRIGCGGRLLESAPKIANIIKRSYDYLPPHQYDIPMSKRFQLSYALKVYWELWPLLLCTCAALGIAMFATVTSLTYTKVDWSFTRSGCISKSMDLRNPTTHKLYIITPPEPWPEMQDALDKMKEAEHRAITRAKLCP